MAASFFQLIIFTILIPFTALAQSNGNVPLGTILIANATSRPWLSPSGDFAFGFRQVQGQDQFILCVWYNNIPDQTLAWFLNSIDPVPEASTIQLDAQNGLILRDSAGRMIWNPSGISGKVDHGFMNDTGDFILMDANENWLWETFSLAADTILPLQELVPESILVSRKSNDSFSKGRFYLQFRENGNLALSTRSSPTNVIDDTFYYSSHTSDPVNSSNSGARAIFDQKGFIYIRRRNNQTVDLSSPNLVPSGYYYRATLDFNGVFSLYYHPRKFTGSPGWTDAWSVPDNICVDIVGQDGSGACGYNSICTLVNRRPNCECPEKYVLVDPNDKYGSCRPNIMLSCGEEFQQGSLEDNYDFVELIDTDFPQNDYEALMPSNDANCRTACLQDCFCAAAISRNDTCWKKKLPLSNGRVDPNLNSKVFLKYDKRSNSSLYSPGFAGPKEQKRNDKGTLITVGSVLLGSSLFMNILFLVVSCIGFQSIYGKRKLRFYPSQGALETNLRCFTYRELEEATDGFKDELGRGSFGIVYRGLMPSGSRTTIAVKKLDRVAEDAEKEFRAEVNTIGQTHHKNLVQLLGFCDEGKHRLLVYEFMCNGTLAGLLFGDSKPSWSLRTQIAIGIARAITYLHEECATQIIHCDIKPQNILLDEHYNARISDFGLAKLLVINQSKTLTNIRGTKGYVAPEWFRSTQITAKVDVYSFGVMLLELICCRRNLEDIEIGGENPILVDWVWDCFQEGRLDSLVEGDLQALDDRITLQRFVMVGIWCIQEDASLRPSMRKASQMLEGVVEVGVPPCPDPFSSTNTNSL